MPLSNSVFISYRRNVSGYPARAVFQDLRANNIDAFMDIQSINSGQFDTIILNQIAARPYFLVILGPGCLKRCTEPGDWLRREIEFAMELNREIIPLLTSEFKFSEPYAKPYLTGKLQALPRYNAVNVPLDYFEEAMIRLRTRFLKPIDRLTTPTPAADRVVVQQKIAEATATPTVTEKQLSAQEYFERALTRPTTDLDGQIADYDEALRLNPQYANAYNNRGIARNNKGDHDGAIADYNEALRLNPQDADAYYNRGIARDDKSDFDGAIADYNEALRLNPLYAYAYNNRGLARYTKGDIDGAIADYDEALRLNPQNANAYNNRGNVRYDRRDFDGAIADYDEALRLNPQYANAYNNRGLVRNHNGDIEGAIADYNEALRLNPQHADAYNNRGAAREDKGDLDSAIADYGVAIRLQPQDAAYYFNRGDTYEKINEHKKAVEDYQQALRINPNHRQAARMRKHIEKHLGGSKGS